jgi:hypothetical protein
MVLRKVIKSNEEKPLFQLFFLKDDEEQSIEVEEVEKINLIEVENRLKQGESIFITLKRKQEANTISVAKEDTTGPWYFSRI